MTQHDDDLRRAADNVRSAATRLPVPTAAGARRRRRRQTAVTAGLATVAIAGVVGLGMVQGSGGESMVASPGGTTPGTSPGTTPGPVPAPSLTTTTAPGETGGDANEPPAPTSTAAPALTTTTRPPLTFSGGYVGLEHYALFTEQCVDIRHRLDATIQMSTGASWAYTADYCGTHDAAGNWSGAGTVDLVGPDGSLRGRFEKTTKVGTPGEPFEVIIESGTGAYGSTRGSCNLTVALREIRFGEQEQSGAITCTVSH